MKIQSSSILEVVMAIGLVSMGSLFVHQCISNLNPLIMYPKEERQNQNHLNEFRKQVFLQHFPPNNSSSDDLGLNHSKDTLFISLFGIKKPLNMQP